MIDVVIRILEAPCGRTFAVDSLSFHTSSGTSASWTKLSSVRSLTSLVSASGFEADEAAIARKNQP